MEVIPDAHEAATCVLPTLPPDLPTIFSSPTRRASTLARVLADRTGLPLSLDSRLCELHFGAWEGLSWHHVHEIDGRRLAHWAEDPMRRSPPDGETGQALVTRICEFLKEHPPSNALLVCHAGPIRVLRALAQRRSDAPPQPLHLDFEKPVVPLALSTLIFPDRAARP